MTGPMTLGSTRTLAGVWEIVYRLHILVQWSLNEYKERFDWKSSSASAASVEGPAQVFSRC
jgi:hypothetical protein